MTWLDQIKLVDSWTPFAIMYNKGMQLQFYQKQATHKILRRRDSTVYKNV